MRIRSSGFKQESGLASLSLHFDIRSRDQWKPKLILNKIDTAVG